MVKTNIFIVSKRRVYASIGFCLGILSHKRFAFVAALIAMAMAMPSIQSGFQGDDLWFRSAICHPVVLEQIFEKGGSPALVADGDPQRTRRMINLGLLPWWCCEDFRLSFWRPISNTTHRLDYFLWPDNPQLMHLQNILWYGAWTLCVSLLYRRLIPIAWVAGLASLFFAIDDAHSIPAGWIANRTTLIAGFFAVASLLLYDKSIQKGTWPWAPLAMFTFTLALLSKEAAIGIFAYFFAYSLFIDSESLKPRLLKLIPYAVIVLIWQITYRFLGFGTNGSEIYIDPASSLLSYLKTIIERGPILLFGQWGFPPPETVWLLTPVARQIFWLISIGLLFVLFYILIPLLKNKRVARFFFSGMLISTVPACTGMISGRMLDYIGLGGMGLLALFLYVMFKEHYWSRYVLARWLCWALLPVLLIIHLHFSPISFFISYWKFGEPLAMRQETLNHAAMMPQLAGKTVLLLNPPHASYASYLQIGCAFGGQPLPAHVWALAPGRFTNNQLTLQVKRLDMYRLQIEVPNGIPVQMERGHDNHLSIGDRIDLDGMTVIISDTDSANLPRTIVFAFPVPLEDPSIVWLQTIGKELLPWYPPMIGETISIMNRIVK